MDEATPNPTESSDAPEAALASKPAVNPWVVAVTLLAAALFVNFWTLGESPLARTEGHRALTGHEIVERGNWVTPTLYGKVYLRKPPGHYWLIAVTEMIAGRGNEFVWRVPSALAAVGVVMLMWGMGRRWFGEVGGAAAGFSCLGMVALWSQNRAAEIDALNTLAAVACACCVLECGFGPTKRRWAWGIGIAVSMAWLLLLKGPAGLPLVGGVFIGASIATQKWAWARRPSVWVSVLIGVAVFAAWGIAAAKTVATEGFNADTSGPSEVLNRLTPDDLGHLFAAASMPFKLIAYSMPWSAVVLLGLLPSVTRSIDDHTMRYRTRAAIGTVIAAMVMCGMVLMTRPRYGYITLPMVSLVVAAFGEAWYRGCFDTKLRTVLRQAMTVTAVLFAGVFGFLAWLASPSGDKLRVRLMDSQTAADLQSNNPNWLIGGAVAAGVLLVFAVVMWIKQKHRPGSWAVVGLIVIASIAFNDYKHIEREVRSGKQVAADLNNVIKPEEAIVAEKAVMDHPEVFYYMAPDDIDRVTRYRGGLAEAFERDQPAWFILHVNEWAEWKPKVGPRVLNVRPLEDIIGKWVMVWYAGSGEALEQRSEIRSQ